MYTRVKLAVQKAHTLQATDWCQDGGMARGKYRPEVRFSIEARQVSAVQMRAGEKLFGRLRVKAQARLIAGEACADDGCGQSGERDRDGRRQEPAPVSDPPHSLTGGS